MSRSTSSTAIEPNYGVVERPSHVPPERVVNFNYFAPPPPGVESYTLLRGLQEVGPDILWSPHNGGHWIATRADDIRWVQENYETFSHEVFTLPRGATKIIMPPLTVDPPHHARFRAIFNTFFTPGRVAAIKAEARELAIALIERIATRESCDFTAEFATVLPVTVFLQIVDLPLDRRDEFHRWAQAHMSAADDAAKKRALVPVVAYLQEILNQRYAAPGPDMLSAIAAWRDNKRFGGEDEVLGMALLIFFGGLDSVISEMTLMMRHLAENPAHRQRILREPAIIPRAVEEYLRRHGLSITGRLITHDVERKGATMKAGEMIMVPIGCSSIDERFHPRAFEVDFDRAENFGTDGRPAHNTFGNGPHRCVGAPLARAELALLLEEWLPRIPEFSVHPDYPVNYHMNVSPGIDRLWLKIGS